MAKRNTGTQLSDAPIVIGLGPGFRVGRDVDAVIETNRGHRLGRVLLSGEAEPNTGVPAPVDGRGAERVLRAPADGSLVAERQIGDFVAEGQVIARVAGELVVAPSPAVCEGLSSLGSSCTGG